MTLNLMMPQQADLKPRITVFGVGGAGGNAVNNMIEKQLDGVEFVVANTDAQALAQSNAPHKIQLGVKVTEGLGAGARPSVGAAAAEETIEEIVDHLAGCAHVLHHRRHGRRHRHGRGADHRAGRARAGRPDRGRGDEALPVRRRQADAPRRGRRRGAPADGRHADHHPEPEPLPARQREDDLHRRLLDGRRRALPGRQGRDRPDGPPGSHQPRLRRRPRGDGRDGQGDDGHGRGPGRGSRDPGGREGDRQPAARRDLPPRAPRACSSTSRAATTSRCSSSTRRRTASARKWTRTPTSSWARRSTRRWRA
jgi:hypothetical protein